MLVLSRRPDESIKLFDPSGRLIAEIMVVSVDRNTVRVGIEAERSFRIMRSELEGITHVRNSGH